MEADTLALAPNHWTVKSVGDVCRQVTSGGTPSRRNPSYYLNGTWPWVKTQELKDTWIDTTEESITETAVSESSAKVLPANTVLVAMYGATVGKLGILRRPMTCNQACCALIADENAADHRFLFYRLLHSRPQLKQLANGAAQQNLSGITIRSLRFPFPPISEQRAIAHILGTLDDKIELNRRMAATLEEMARAIFKSWFIDFDPVRAKAEGRPTGLPPEIDVLFPDSFEESPMGFIPAGWAASSVSNLIDLNPSRPLKKGQVAKYLDMANVRTAGLSVDAVIEREFGSGTKLMNGDTLLARITPCLENGKTAYVDFLEEGEVGWGSTEFIVMRPKHPLPNEFAYCLARDDVFRDFAIQSMTGSSGRQRVQAEAIGRFRIAEPPEGLAHQFKAHVTGLFERVRVCERESKQLTLLRDHLLPKLISGEVSVREVEFANAKARA